ERGAIVVVSTYLLHRDPEVFENPAEFRPSRFERELPRHSYLPFGAGPRACLGRHFGMLQARISLATLLSRLRFELQPGGPVAPEMLITLRPRGGIRARATRTAQ